MYSADFYDFVNFLYYICIVFRRFWWVLGFWEFAFFVYFIVYKKYVFRRFMGHSYLFYRNEQYSADIWGLYDLGSFLFFNVKKIMYSADFLDIHIKYYNILIVFRTFWEIIWFYKKICIPQIFTTFIFLL